MLNINFNESFSDKYNNYSITIEDYYDQCFEMLNKMA